MTWGRLATDDAKTLSTMERDISNQEGANVELNGDGLITMGAGGLVGRSRGTR
jgi:hypothetical protein